MSRTVDANEFAAESFSGLLERLTRRDGQENAHSDSAPGRVAPSASSRRQAVLPVMEVKPGKSKGDSESVMLSYEQALRIHGRHNRLTDARSVLPKIEPSHGDRQDAPSAESHTEPVPVQTGNKKTFKKAKTSPTASAQPSAVREAAEGAFGAKTERSHKSASKTDILPKAARFTSAPSGAPARSSASTAPDVHRTPQPKDGPAATRKQQHKRGGRQGAKEIKAQENLALELQKHSSQLGHRRTILSVRLSDQESDQLRLRAAESGLSVSAYMRSCVMEAEHLRAQVKQALAEMRAVTGQNRQTILPPPVANSDLRSHGLGSGERWAWSRLLAKSAAALLGFWLPFRRGG